MKHLSFLIFFLIFCVAQTHAQFIVEQGKTPEVVSIIEHATFADAGKQQFSVEEIRDQSSGLSFRKMSGINGNLGFTDHNYWLKFELRNLSDAAVLYYLETAEPVTDEVNLFLFSDNNQITTQRSGDKLPFAQRSVPFRKTMFRVELQPGEKKEALLEVKNDGEKNNLPLNVISQERFLKITYADQLVMGIFYGILFIIAVTYLFFYFALKERIFLFYTLYVGFAGLCQFALDGFFHQYIDQSNSWFNLHAVILSAIAAAYFFGRYSELVLDAKKNFKKIFLSFRFLYILLGATLALVVLFPSFLAYSYPIVNVLTLSGMLLIAIAIITLLVRRQPVDLFYTFGIGVLFICFTLAIMMNFGLVTGFSIDNITKPGIGLEVIMLSLSMANRIRVLKSKKEELQTIALRKSQEMNDVKSYFLSNMSHELRTPLNAILGLTGSMEHETTDAGVKRGCGEIRNAAFSLMSSVNDIMDFSKIEKGEIRLEKVRFSPITVLERLRENYRQQALTKGLAFHFSSTIDESVVLWGDPGRLEQMINNVLSNAVKFTASGSVWFNVTTEERDSELTLIISIRDSGIGISPDKLESVFDMFSQADISDKRRFGGFGIGLCVVKALVNLHGGSIELHSDEGRGTECVMRLEYTVAPPEVKLINRYSQEDYDLLGARILVVEDNPMNQMVLKMMMRKWQGTTVSFSNNGAESLDALRSGSIDIILMDLQMPVMDGYDATAAIRRGEAGTANSDIPIIVVTADVMETTRERIMDLGADDFTTKPIDEQVLYEKITTVLSASTIKP